MDRVERLADGSRLVHLVTDDATATACPTCGTFATLPKGWTCTRPRDLPYGQHPLRLIWRKRRWYCTQPACARTSFTESVAQVPARARITTRLRQAAGDHVCDDGCTVVQAGRGLGLSWPTVMAAVRTQARPIAEAEPEPVKDEHTGAWKLVVDRWHVGFVDISGGQGLLGQAEGRTSAVVTAWINERSPAWREAVRYVAIDMCTIFKSAVSTALPPATLVVDHFPVVQLANKAVTEVRQRTTLAMRRRRGRKGDGEWDIRRLLGRGQETLSARQLARLWNTLIDLGEPGVTILTAWIAKEELRTLLGLARSRPARTTVAHRLARFYPWCAESGIAEIERLAGTIEAWWPQIEAFIQTGITNAASEGINRVVKLTARCAYGFRNPDNQRLRTRCVTTRRARGCLRTAQLR